MQGSTVVETVLELLKISDSLERTRIFNKSNNSVRVLASVFLSRQTTLTMTFHKFTMKNDLDKSL